MLLELRELLSSLKKILTPLRFSDVKSKSAGNLLRLPSKKKKKPGRSFKDLKMKSPSFTKLSSKDQVSLLDKITLSISS